MNQKEIKKYAKFIAEQWTNEVVAGSQALFYDRLPPTKNKDNN